MACLVMTSPLEVADDVRVLFSVASPRVPGTLEVWIQGQKQPRACFAETTSSTFTMVEAPFAGQDIQLSYRQA